MVKRTGPTNPIVQELIRELRKASIENNVRIWRAVAEKLEKPRRQKVAVNLSKINRYVKNGEIALVPGKVLSCGNIRAGITIAALKFSKKALEKIEKAGAKAISIKDLMKTNPKGSNVRIIC